MKKYKYCGKKKKDVRMRPDPYNEDVNVARKERRKYDRS